MSGFLLFLTYPHILCLMYPLLLYNVKTYKARVECAFGIVVCCLY